MESYVKWLQRCVNNIQNIKVGDFTTYIDALKWQALLVLSVLLVIVVIAVVVGIVAVGPIAYLKTCKKKFIQKTEDIVAGLQTRNIGTYSTDMMDIKFLLVESGLLEEDKYECDLVFKMCVTLRIIAGIVVFLIMPVVFINKYIGEGILTVIGLLAIMDLIVYPIVDAHTGLNSLLKEFFIKGGKDRLYSLTEIRIKDTSVCKDCDMVTLHNLSSAMTIYRLAVGISFKKSPHRKVRVCECYSFAHKIASKALNNFSPSDSTNKDIDKTLEALKSEFDKRDFNSIINETIAELKWQY